jgi:hypothetical protein
MPHLPGLSCHFHGRQVAHEMKFLEGFIRRSHQLEKLCLFWKWFGPSSVYSAVLPRIWDVLRAMAQKLPGPVVVFQSYIYIVDVRDLKYWAAR